MKRKIHPNLKLAIKLIASFILIIFSNLYLQWCQNNLSVELALKFAFFLAYRKVFLSLSGAAAFLRIIGKSCWLARSRSAVL